MRSSLILLILVLSASDALGQYPFESYFETGAFGGKELSDAFYHEGRSHLLIVNDKSEILRFRPDLTGTIQQMWTTGLTGTDLEGITFRESGSSSNGTCFLLNENNAPQPNPVSSIIEYNLDANGGLGATVRTMLISPIFEFVDGPVGRGPEALTWVPATALPVEQRPTHADGYFYLGWEHEFPPGSGKNKVWVFQYTDDVNTNALERAINVPGLTDANGTFLIDDPLTPAIETPAAAQEQFRVMHFDRNTGFLWALFADATFPQTVIRCAPDGRREVTVFTYNGSGSLQHWEAIALRPCPAPSHSLFLASDDDDVPLHHVGSIYGFDRCCQPGDCNYDERVDGLDIQPFVNILLNPPQCVCPADVNRDGFVTIADVAALVC